MPALNTYTNPNWAEDELRATRARLEHVLRCSPVVTYTLSMDFTPTWITENVLYVLGYTVEEALTPGWWSAHVHPEDHGEAGRAGILERGGGWSEYRFQKKDGHHCWLREQFRIIRDSDGNPAEIIGSLVDITERRELEEEFRQAQKMEAVGRLAGGIAHDFNNLLTIIRGSASLVLDDLPADDARRKDLQEIERAADRATRMTRQLLAFSRRQVLQPRILALDGLVSEMEQMLRRLIGEDIELVIRSAPGLRRVKADPGQLEQVIMNLVVNARDSMPRGGRLMIETDFASVPELQLDGSCPRSSGGYVVLRVQDTGCGIPEQVRPHIFEPFFTTKEHGKGTGLGLSTVYGIVQQSGGCISFDSALGRGTSFRIYLPAVSEAAEEARGPTFSGEDSTGTETVLLVEDDPGVRSFAARVLRARGYTILEARDGRDAIAVAEKHSGPIDLLITDVVMPQMSGRVVAERLAEQHPETRVLFMSGYTNEAIVQHGVLAPGTAFLEKPFTPAVLAARARQVLGTPVRAKAAG